MSAVVHVVASDVLFSLPATELFNVLSTTLARSTFAANPLPSNNVGADLIRNYSPILLLCLHQVGTICRWCGYESLIDNMGRCVTLLRPYTEGTSYEPLQ